VKQIILGTAGHIDHGKTSLIKAVTGIDTDRLKEEKLRGITIELGFASMDLPNGQHIGVVDVPGHEKFIKNMVAGATGIDIVAMVIAADEGVMPQTREHLEICSLLGVEHGFVVLSKTDLVDEEWLELVVEDIKDFVQGTFLENQPIIPVSSVTGQGLEDFTHTLDELSLKIPDRPLSSLFRLPVDRVFTMKGFGTVITGTLVSGSIRVGDTIMIYPSKITSKVRGIQVHSESVTEAFAGMRTAINFQGLEKASVIRGQTVSTPGALIPGFMVDASVNFLQSNKKPFKNRTQIRFHSGTSEVLGYLILLDRAEILPGDTSVVQIRLDSPVSLVKDDRFVIRSYSPVRTIGGGRVLNPIPKKHKRFQPEITSGLETIAHRTPIELIAFYAETSGSIGVSYPELKVMTNLSEKELQSALQELLSKKRLILADRDNQIYIHGDSFNQLKSQTLSNLRKYHEHHPLKSGMPKEELKSKFPLFVSGKLFHLILGQLIKDDELVQEEEAVRLAAHKVSLGVDQKMNREKILTVYKNGDLTPPYFKELCKDLDIDPITAKDVLNLLVDDGLVVKVKEDLYFLSDAVKALERRLVDLLESNGEMTTPQFKELAGVSRKYLIPLIEHFDARNVTIRVGDIRKLRTKPK
jgi:selenocysteine-specific elongation factor